MTWHDKAFDIITDIEHAIDKAKSGVAWDKLDKVHNYASTIARLAHDLERVRHHKEASA